MKIRYLFNLIVLFLLTGCYPSISGTVIDAETGKPIEGAIALVQWTKAQGLPGMPYHEVYRIVETETDKEGKFSIPSSLNPLVDTPELVIYKEGYVAWRNDYIFPSWEKRNNKIAPLIKLIKWDEKYSHDEHHSFMGYAIMVYVLNSIPRFHEVLNKESIRGTHEENGQMQKAK